MENTELVTIEKGVISPTVNAHAIQEVKVQIHLLQNMVKDLLIKGVDYGRIPGTPSDSLWDPGASQIISAFSCYVGERRFLKFEDSDTKISVCVEVPLISRETGKAVATGVGAASTLETKYKYRWVKDPGELGYIGEAMADLKTKSDGRGETLYRIPNPEYSELLNTIVKMASKRAEVDAAESLPGVASVLRQMFSGVIAKGQPAPAQKANDTWTRFWGEVRRLGLTQEEAYIRLSVASMKEWLNSGHSIEEALDTLRGRGDGPDDPVFPED